MAEGWERLGEGRCREAADAFGRVLLQDPDEDSARAGLEKARAGLAEEARLLDAHLADAERAIEAGDAARARELLEGVMHRGGDRDRAARLLDRLTDAGGTLVLGALTPRRATRTAPLAERRGPSWSRRALVAAWAVVFGLLAGAVSLSWEDFLKRLVKTPAPTSSVRSASTQTTRQVPGR